MGETFCKLKKVLIPDVISITEPANKEVLRKKVVDLSLKSSVLKCLLPILSQLAIAKWF